MLNTLLVAAAIVATDARPPAAAQSAPGSVEMQPGVLPYSLFATGQTARAFNTLRAQDAAKPPPSFAETAAIRAYYARQNDSRLVAMRALYPVRIEHTSMNGVEVAIVTPLSASAADANRVLVNLHGGAFLWGAGSGGLVEAIPIAAMSRITVVTVDYRMAPEYRYPAASEDVAAVYRALLKTHAPGEIGIYGCSAGGVLAAQATAWMLSHGLPAPGAIGTFCGTGLPFGGDSVTWASLSTGQSIPPGGSQPLRMPYLAQVADTDPIAYPGTSDAMLRRFPPTLLLAGGRDFAASSLTAMQRRLLAVGRDAELVLFDGLWHAFFVDPALPESREAYGVIANFFDRKLTRRAPRRDVK